FAELRRPMIFHTPMPIDVCQAALEANVDRERFGFTMSGYAGKKPVLAKFKRDGFRLQWRRNYQNGYAPFFYGRLQSTGLGTRVEGEFSVGTFTKVFMTFWFSGLAFFFFLMLFSLLSGWGQFQVLPLAALSVPVGMALFGVAMFLFGCRLARNEEKAILEF